MGKMASEQCTEPFLRQGCNRSACYSGKRGSSFADGRIEVVTRVSARLLDQEDGLFYLIGKRAFVPDSERKGELR